MFTGIIESLGKISAKEQSAQNILLKIEPVKADFLNDIKNGSSISVNGVCLTITEFENKFFKAFISTETYQITNLKDLNVGELVNLEKALRLNDRLDGHLVMGHIDNVGVITRINKIHQDYQLEVRMPADLLKYIIPKGSIAINGISLTIVKRTSDILSFAIIPETFRNTNIPNLKASEKVNIEIDMFAKYAFNFSMKVGK